MMSNKKRMYIIIGAVLGVIVLIGSYYLLSSKSVIEFNNNPEKIEIKSEYDAKSFIKTLNEDESHLEIDTSNVNTDELGDYVIVYRLKDKEYQLKVEVVDTVAPTFEIQNLDIDVGTVVKADDAVKDIQDQTKTKTYFKEEYDFTKAGEQDVIVVVEDAGGNKTEKTVHIKIVKDEEKPTLTGLHDITSSKNNKIDYLSGVKAKDNRDPEPKVDVDSSRVDISKVGTYDVKYTVKDRSGNENTYTKKVTITAGTSVSSKAPDGNKIVYLTFDDGPSSNTAKVLDVLDKYNVKATFFVTGNGQKYNYLIKQAHDKGHTIGLHTYTHSYSKVYASVDAYFNDLDKVGQMVKGQIGFVPKYIRFPGGASNTVSRHYSKGIMSKLVSEVQNRGYQYYDWNASTGDASGNNVAVNKLINGGTSSHANNIMILAHDTAAKSTTVQALPSIIEHYQALGYTFKGIDDNSFTPHQHVNN